MFRISNDIQRAKTAATIENFRTQRDTIENQKGKKVADVFWKGCQNLVIGLENQIRKYDALRQGIAPFQGKDLKDLGAYLVDARIASGVTQKELAEKLGVSQPMIFKYEANAYQGYSLDVLDKVIYILNVSVDLTAWKRQQEPVYARSKQENAVLYFLNRINNASLGKTKLMKLLYYTDFEFYETDGRSLTGDKYIAYPRGPVPEKAEKLIAEMEKDGKLHSEKVNFGGYEQIKYYPKLEADISVFTEQERRHLENIANRFEFWTATQMSNLSHDEYPWKNTRLGDVIDYHLASFFDREENKEI